MIPDLFFHEFVIAQLAVTHELSDFFSEHGIHFCGQKPFSYSSFSVAVSLFDGLQKTASFPISFTCIPGFVQDAVETPTSVNIICHMSIKHF